MSRLIDKPMTLEEYEQAAREYYQTLPLEHFMEAIPQSTQRKIALESLDLLHTYRPDVQLFSELLIQYYHEGVLTRVVPDNMVRLHDKPVLTKGSFNLAPEPVGPLWVLEWVSDSSEGKDYEDCFHKYEQELRIRYCLQYHPGKKDLRVYQHTGTRYEPIPFNAQGRQAIPELDLEIGLLGGWVRFWYKGKLLGLPADLQKEIDTLKNQVTRATKKAEKEKQRTEQEKQRAEQEKQGRLAAEAELARLRAQAPSQGHQPPTTNP